MNHFFLLNEAIEVTDLVRFKVGMADLMKINKNTDSDVFLRHGSIYNLEIINELYFDYGQMEQGILMFIEQHTPCEKYLHNDSTIDDYFPTSSNAFLGIDFQEITEIVTERQITNDIRYSLFKKGILWDVSFRDFWEKRKDLFPNLELCGEVEAQISRIGNSGYFRQIIERLRDLNEFVKNWTEGDFNYRIVNRDYPLRISPESTSTMNLYRNERLFSLPNGRRECFELHIKTGDLRFHFFPDNQDKMIYVGYIGTHLSTSTG